MVFGGVEQELLQLNESTLWSGGPVRLGVNPAAVAVLPQVRKALLQDQDYGRADHLARQMQGLYSASYLPLGDVQLKQDLGGQAPTRLLLRPRPNHTSSNGTVLWLGGPARHCATVLRWWRVARKLVCQCM
jgi:hypothetical protein